MFLDVVHVFGGFNQTVGAEWVALNEPFPKSLPITIVAAFSG
jgi:hypothetical protein